MMPHRHRHRPERAGLRLAATVLLAALVLAACGGTKPSPSATTSASPAPGATTTAPGAPVPGGTANFAEQPNSAAFYTFPLTPSNIGSLYTITQFQNLLWRPLYWFGQQGQPVFNAGRSLAYPPVFSDGGRVATIRLKPWSWSDGQPVVARDVLFWVNLLKAEKDHWSAYVPGYFPDNVASARAVGTNTVVLDLTGAYGASWFTDNELSQVVPIPQHAWDKVSASSPVGNYDETPAGARAVYQYLTTEAGLYATYATNPLWKVVDGPWQVTQFQSDGLVELSPNPAYSGKKPTLAHLFERPFTSGSAEVNELLTGGVDYGYLPPQDVALIPRLQSLGYRVVPTYSWSINFIPLNFHNPTVGPILSQLYVRQALQRLVDQPGLIHAAFHGYAAPVYGPVPIDPANPYASAVERANPYPYDPAAAQALLAAHGWSVRPDATSTCVRPGTSATQCGAGIAKGAALAFSLNYYGGQPGLSVEMGFLRSSFSQAGIALDLRSEPLGTLNSSYSRCTAGQPTCTWQMVQGGLSWTFVPDYYPTSAEFLSSQGSSNSGSYASPTADRLIALSHTGSLSALQAAEDYLAKDLPVIWLPAPATITVVRGSLAGTEPGDPFFGLYASDWYFTK